MKNRIESACAVLLLTSFSLGCGRQESPSAPAPPASSVASQPDFMGVLSALREKNPSYNGQGQFTVEPEVGPVGSLAGTGVADLSPLRGIAFCALDLRELPIADLRPLSGMPLRMLGLERTRVTDLSPLKGMKLEKLYLNEVPVSDLSPLAGMPLVELMMPQTAVSDVGPLRGAPVRALWLNETRVANISSLAQCPLVTLTLEKTAVADLSPLAGMKSLERLHIGGTPVSDLSPLQGLALTRLIFTPSRITNGLAVARGMASLTEVGTTLEGKMPPEEFWRMLDEGKLP
jgi:internalin A